MGLMNFNLGDIGNVFTSIRESITGEKIKDPAEMAKISLQLSQLESMASQGQISINKIEAAHKSLFVAGWRPFIGWVSGSGIAYSFILKPLLDWFLKMYITFSDKVFTVEQIEAMQPISLDTGTLIGLVTSMLGMATLRTYEKHKSVAREK